MYRKIIGILICILFFGACVCPSNVGIYEHFDKNEITDYNSQINQAIENKVILNNNWTEQVKLIASDGDSGDLFGYSVDVYEDTIIIGAPWNNSIGEKSGSAYVFTRSGSNWTQQAKLLASDGELGDLFGQPVTISGDTVIIGAYRSEIVAGSAYIFRRNGTSWIEEQKITASDGETGDYFGITISIDNDYAVIGAIYDKINTRTPFLTGNGPPASAS